MKRVWQLQEAKNKFSEVVDEAISSGPQIITRRGADTAVLLSYADYRKLVLQQQSLSTFFASSPLAEVELDLTRDKSRQRKDVFE